MYSQTPEYNTAFRRRSQLGIQKKGIGGFLIPDSSIIKTDRHDITETLLKVAVNAKTITRSISKRQVLQ
jgi:hypothetical protein